MPPGVPGEPRASPGQSLMMELPPYLLDVTWLRHLGGWRHLPWQVECSLSRWGRRVQGAERSGREPVMPEIKNIHSDGKQTNDIVPQIPLCQAVPKTVTVQGRLHPWGGHLGSTWSTHFKAKFNSKDLCQITSSRQMHSA